MGINFKEQWAGGRALSPFFLILRSLDSLKGTAVGFGGLGVCSQSASLVSFWQVSWSSDWRETKKTPRVVHWVLRGSQQALGNSLFMLLPQQADF